MLFRKRFLHLIIGINFFTNIISFSDPNIGISKASKISVDVVKPVEIHLTSEIYHSIFKGTSKKIIGDFFIDIKASPNIEMKIIYDKEVQLIKNNGNIILLILNEINSAISSTTTQNFREIKIKNPINMPKKRWFIPYEIDIQGNEETGSYKGQVNITIQYS